MESSLDKSINPAGYSTFRTYHHFQLHISRFGIWNLLSFFPGISSNLSRYVIQCSYKANNLWLKAFIGWIRPRLRWHSFHVSEALHSRVETRS
jgi:hypothetical protein